MSRSRQILLYGMSANPIVGMKGHMGAVAFCRSMGYDEIWILPVFQHIYSTKRGLAPFEDRIAMCKLAIDELQPPADGCKGRVLVKEYERELFELRARETDKPEELRLGSVDLVRYLSDKFPDAAFTMLLGADTFADLQAGKWKNAEELKQRVKLLVMSRLGYEAPDRSAESDRIRFITIPTLGNISSTYVRSVTDADELRSCVAPAVAEYIMLHKLYAFSE